jgi:hypothetical protein
MESRSSSPQSQQPSICPYPEPDHPVNSSPLYLSKIQLNIIHPPTSWSSYWSLSFWLSHQYTHSSFLNSFYIPFSSSFSSNRCNYTRRRVQVMKLLTMQLSPTLCHFIPLRSKYSPLHPLPSVYVPPLMTEAKFRNHTETEIYCTYMLKLQPGVLVFHFRIKEVPSSNPDIGMAFLT